MEKTIQELFVRQFSAHTYFLPDILLGEHNWDTGKTPILVDRLTPYLLKESVLAWLGSYWRVFRDRCFWSKRSSTNDERLVKLLELSGIQYGVISNDSSHKITFSSEGFDMDDMHY